ncbi:hypothetical protein Misp06_01263 [Microbulbifer sp. NBRC 101763]
MITLLTVVTCDRETLNNYGEWMLLVLTGKGI